MDIGLIPVRNNTAIIYIDGNGQPFPCKFPAGNIQQNINYMLSGSSYESYCNLISELLFLSGSSHESSSKSYIICCLVLVMNHTARIPIHNNLVLDCRSSMVEKYKKFKISKIYG